MHFPEPSRIPHLFSNLPHTDSPAFGLLAWLESTRIPLPLRGVEARFVVTGELAEVTVEQLFVQNCRESVDLTYTFPLPARATLFRCEMVLEGRVVAARAMTESEAQAAFRAAKQEGLRALIVEEVRQNLFSLALGNVPPGAVVLLRLVYAQSLERWQRQLALRIPFCPGVRYIPGTPLLRSPTGTGSMEDTDQVPDASRISPPRIDALHPDAAPVFVSGTIAVSDVAPGSLVSPTHPLTWREQAGVIHAGLVPGAHLPDRDLVIRWEMPAVDATMIRFVGHRLRSPEGDYHVLRLSCPPVEVHRAPVDVRVLLDHSSSMIGDKWTKSVEALHAFTRALHPDDRLGLTLFSNTPRDFAEVPLPPAQILADPRFLGLGDLCPDGGTELLPALQHVAGISHRNPNRSLHLILITDGQVGNEAEIFAAARNFDGTPFHTVGIDTAVNDALLERLAADSGGRCLLLTPADNLVDPIAALAGELGDPARRHLRFSEGVLLAGSARSEVRSGQTTTWLLRTATGQSPELLADHPDGRTETLCPTIQDTQSLAPRLLWMQATARAHLARHEVAQARALAISGNFLITGISFLAVDPTTRVPIAYQQVEQPVVSFACAEISPRAALSAGLTYSPRVGAMMQRQPNDEVLRAWPVPSGCTQYAENWALLLAKLINELQASNQLLTRPIHSQLQVNNQLLIGPIHSQLYLPLATWFASIGGPDEPQARATLESVLLRLFSRTELGVRLNAALKATHARILDLRRSSSYEP